MPRYRVDVLTGQDQRTDDEIKAAPEKPNRWRTLGFIEAKDRTTAIQASFQAWDEANSHNLCLREVEPDEAQPLHAPEEVSDGAK